MCGVQTLPMRSLAGLSGDLADLVAWRGTVRGKAHGWPSTIRRRPSWHARGTCATLACSVSLLCHCVMRCLVILPYGQSAQAHAVGLESSQVLMSCALTLQSFPQILTSTHHNTHCIPFKHMKYACTCDDERLRAAVR